MPANIQPMLKTRFENLEFSTWNHPHVKMILNHKMILFSLISNRVREVKFKNITNMLNFFIFPSKPVIKRAHSNDVKYIYLE